MLAQVFNPTETKKNGPARMPASTPARRSALPFTAASAVLPATSQKLRRCPRHRQRRSSSLVLCVSRHGQVQER
jgi:hypothetical protein